jgi:hypothetical protein
MGAAAQLFEHPFGAVSWLMDEPMRRTSHALAVGGGVWLVDPVDHTEAMARVAALGPPAGVLQLIDRHNRDCASIARRLNVPHHTVPDALPNTTLQTIAVLRLPVWRETALWWPGPRVLVVAETIGTAPAFTAGHGAVGMHPLLRLLPPRALRATRPEHLLPGHGPPVSGPDARDGVDWAYAHARRDLPRLLLALTRLARG